MSTTSNFDVAYADHAFNFRLRREDRNKTIHTAFTY